ncbi:MAG: large conductance mechanosensitive channel protein MscL [Granulosicoccaceae bacterium]
MKLLNEFKEFAVKGDVVDMGVGIVIGAAFTSIVNSMVKDIFTPVLAMFTTGVNFGNWFFTLREGDKGGPYTSIAQAQADNAITINIGLFINSAISFIIVAAVLFFIIRAINRIRRPQEVTADPAKTKECPHCFSSISIKATRCPFCTAYIKNE